MAGALDPGVFLRVPGALAALRRLVSILRRSEFLNTVPDVSVRPDISVVHRLALGERVRAASLPAGTCEPLVAVGALVADGEEVEPRFGLINVRGLVALIPRAVGPDDVIYVGPDSIELLRLAWRLRPGGERALDLGSGTGFMSAALMSRYRHVIASELDARAAATTAVTIALNRPPDRRADVVMGDVGTALADESFDLVVANPPWVPTNERIGGSTFADGGPTGSELPTRFARDIARLVAPGGLGLMITLDSIWADGRRPAHGIAVAVGARDLEVSVHDVDHEPTNVGLQRLVAASGGRIREARLAALIIERAPEQDVSSRGQTALKVETSRTPIG